MCQGELMEANMIEYRQAPPKKMDASFHSNCGQSEVQTCFTFFSISLAVHNIKKILVIESCSFRLPNKNVNSLDNTHLLLS